MKVEQSVISLFAILSFYPHLIEALMRHEAQLVHVPSPCGENNAIYSV